MKIVKIIILSATALLLSCNPMGGSESDKNQSLLHILLSTAPRALTPDAVLPGSSAVNVGGKVSGIGNGNTATILINGKDSLVLSESRNYQNFLIAHPKNTEYKLEVQETKGVNCTIQNATGTPDSDIKNADINCESKPGTVFVKVGGTVTGITGNITLSMTGEVTQTKTISTNGSYQFDTSLYDGKNFTVSISAQSNTAFCYLPNATASHNTQQTGTTTSTNTTDVNVTCVGRITLNEVCSNTCTGSPSSADFIELKNISGSSITISGSDWYSCDAGICGGTFNSATDVTNLVAVPAQTFNNNAYLTPTITYGLGNGDAAYLVYRANSKNYLVESYIFAAHVVPARKSPDGDFNGTTNSGTWVTGGTITYGTANP